MKIKAIFFDFFGVINNGGELNREIAEFIQLNNSKYLFAILSATQGDLHDWLITHGINDYFSLVQTTSKLELSKSDPEFYKKALEVLDLNMKQAILVDDNPQYTGLVRRLGMSALDYDARNNFLEQIKPLL